MNTSIQYSMVLNQSFTGVYDLVGWKFTKLSWNESNTRWEFTNMEQELIADCNDTEEYPLGTQR